MSTEEEEKDILILKPNEEVVIPLSEAFQNHFEMLKEDQPEFICRVFIQDQSEHGVVLPANLIDNKEISFLLPEQLCVFNPEKIYLLKAEVVLETELVTPFITHCRIDLNGLLEPVEEEEGEEGEQNLEASEEAINQSVDSSFKEPEENTTNDDNLDSVLDTVAPVAKTQFKKTIIEDIVKQLDQEFVKNALWGKEEKASKSQVAPIPIKEPELPLSPEGLAIKQKMKNLLRNMLD